MSPRPRTITCLGYSSDDTFAYTARRFAELARRAPAVFDLSAVSASGFRFDFSPSGPDDSGSNGASSTAPGTCRVPGIAARLRPSMAVYHRLTPVSHRLAQGDPRFRPLATAEYAAAVLLDTDFFAMTVNPVSAGWTNGVRPLHYRELAEMGMHVPAYLVTSDPDDARAFISRHGDVFVKSVSHHRTIARRVTPDRLQTVDRVAHSPCLLQVAVTGPDVRVHVVGEECFALAITADADDYRYVKQEDLTFSPVDPPLAVARRCVDATRHLGLLFSGIDFKVCATSGRWYCLEANPMPGYSGYDRRLGGAISHALTELLENGRQVSR